MYTIMGNSKSKVNLYMYRGNNKNSIPFPFNKNIINKGNCIMQNATPMGINHLLIVIQYMDICFCKYTHNRYIHAIAEHKIDSVIYALNIPNKIYHKTCAIIRICFEMIY